MKKTFEEYLQERFINQFTGTKDQAESAEENWFERLDVSELIEYGDEYAKQEKNDLINEIIQLYGEEYYKDTTPNFSTKALSDELKENYL